LALCSPRIADKLRSGVILLLHIVMMALTAAAAWWLSGYDTKLTGEDKPSDRLRRGVRCGITVLLVEVAFSSLLRWWRYRDQTSGYVYLAVALPLGITWAGCLSEFCARGFQRLVFPEDHREADLGESRRSMDRITRLIQEGRREEAIDLCQQLRASGSASDLALEAMLFRLGVEPSSVGGEGAKKNKPLAEADRLRTQGNLTQAEVKLTDLLKQEPSNQAAALMLMRLYAEDRQRRDLAEAELSRITNQRHIPPAFIEYARRSIAEWSAPRAGTEDRDDTVESLPLPHPAGESPSPTAPAAAVSVDELIANGCLGTAIERLEEELKERPNDFDLWLKLAEAQAVHCGNLSRAGKIVERLKTNPAFTSEQVQQAQAKLKEWKVGRGSH
jgi:hypothetical protein